MLLLLLVVTLLGVLYKYWVYRMGYWKRKGVPFVEPTLFAGSRPSFTFLTDYLGYSMKYFYEQLAPHPYGGLYSTWSPILFPRDPEVIKLIMTKEFSHFRDRGLLQTDPKKDPLGLHLFALDGDLWKAVRVKLTPTFTSGKLKVMMALFQSCATQLTDHMEEMVRKGEEVDIKDFMARFSTDVIGTCAFGIDTNSMKDPNNAFREIGKKVFPPFVRTRVRVVSTLYGLIPGLDRLYRFKTMESTVEEFILRMVKETVEYREKNSVKRNDFLDLLISLKNKTLKDSDASSVGSEDIEMTIDLLAAQCFVFFAAGFETSSSVLSFSMYELALHPEIQERARQEVESKMKEHGGLTYQALQDMPYLDQVISETLRKYPTLPLLHRRCTRDFKFPDSDVVIEKGTKVVIPTFALHHDPKYYPSPETFDPERFSPENKRNIPDYAFLPFGEGPRLCIGMRFGQLQVRTGLAAILSKFKICPSERTKVPLSFITTTLITMTDGPIYLRFQRR